MTVDLDDKAGYNGHQTAFQILHHAAVSCVAKVQQKDVLLRCLLANGLLQWSKQRPDHTSVPYTDLRTLGELSPDTSVGQRPLETSEGKCFGWPGQFENFSRGDYTEIHMTTSFGQNPHTTFRECQLPMRGGKRDALRSTTKSQSTTPQK